VAGRRAAAGAQGRPGALCQPAPPEGGMPPSAQHTLRPGARSRPVLPSPAYLPVAAHTHRRELVPLPHPPGNEHPCPKKFEKSAGGVKGWGRVS